MATGKRQSLVTTAIAIARAQPHLGLPGNSPLAREMAAFLWAIGHEVDLPAGVDECHRPHNSLVPPRHVRRYATARRDLISSKDLKMRFDSQFALRKSCPSLAAIGQSPVTHCEDLLRSSEVTLAYNLSIRSK